MQLEIQKIDRRAPSIYYQFSSYEMLAKVLKLWINDKCFSIAKIIK